MANRLVFAVVLGPLAWAYLWSSAAQNTGEDQYVPVRQEIPKKCECGCGRDFLDCDHDCPLLDGISSKKETELADPIPVRIEVPRELFPKDQWTYGMRVTKVFPDTPATNGGTMPGGKGNRVILEPGDIITHINGAPVKGFTDYYELMHGNNEKCVTVIDWKDQAVYNDYFRPKGGRIGIKIEPTKVKLKVKNGT
jgi:hypothetical protein